jgi:DNA/RNA-binding domain of Phe-tRNA-synthetase-like protein
MAGMPRFDCSSEPDLAKLVITELTPKFPDFRVALVVAEGLAIAPHRSATLDSEIAEAEARCRERWSGVELSAIPGVAAWRAAYRTFGIKKTSYRSSVERLIKRVLAGDRLPKVNALVDLYNLVSIESGLCLGCDDFDAIDGDLAFRFARPGDTFLDMGAGEGEDPLDPPKAGEVVYADARHVLCRRWNWRQDARSLLNPQTRRAVLTVQSNGFGDVEAAARRVAEGIARECGGISRIVVTDRQAPVREF